MGNTLTTPGFWLQKRSPQPFQRRIFCFSVLTPSLRLSLEDRSSFWLFVTGRLVVLDVFQAVTSSLSHWWCPLLSPFVPPLPATRLSHFSSMVVATDGGVPPGPLAGSRVWGPACCRQLTPPCRSQPAGQGAPGLLGPRGVVL